MAKDQKIISLITASSLLLVAAAVVLIIKLSPLTAVAGTLHEKQRSEVRSMRDFDSEKSAESSESADKESVEQKTPKE